CHVSNAPLLGSALMLSHSRTSLRNSASSGVSSKSTPILLVRLQRVWATTRVFPQSAGPNCEPTENVAVRAEPLCGEARAEAIWRSQVGPALGGSRLEPRDEQILPAPGAAHHEAAHLAPPVVAVA